MSIIDISEPIRVGPKNLFMFNHFHCTSVLFLANVIESQIILFIERFHLFTCYVVSFDLHILLVYRPTCIGCFVYLIIYASVSNIKKIQFSFYLV